MTECVDLAVVGSGPVGATLALALAGSGFNSVVLEARPADAPVNDRRTLALSEASRQILQRLGVWQALAAGATPISTIHVSQRGGLGRTVLRADELGRPQLGHVLRYAALCRALDQAMAARGIAVRFGTRVVGLQPEPDRIRVISDVTAESGGLQAKLAVLADGGRGLAEAAGLRRETTEYRQHAVVGQLSCEIDHGYVAYERFTPQGPVALLPDGPRSFALVWTATPEESEALLGLPDAAFLQRLHAHFGDRAGTFLGIRGRAAYPLKLSRVRPVVSERLVVIGNAAQTLHPVAGQGFNLGLRDAWELALMLRDATPDQLGEAALLNAYQSRRKPDTTGGMLFTDFLARTFANDLPGLAGMRGLGLGLTELVPPVKRFLADRMSFGANG